MSREQSHRTQYQEPRITCITLQLKGQDTFSGAENNIHWGIDDIEGLRNDTVALRVQDTDIE